MAQCAEKGCKKFAIANGFCEKHGGKVAATKARNPTFQTSTDYGATWTNTDAVGMKTWLDGVVDSAQQNNTPAMIAAMQDGAGGGRTSRSNVNGLGTVYHASQGSGGKAGALSIFWVELTKDTVQPVAIGAHTESASYKFSWTSKLWTKGKNFSF